MAYISEIKTSLFSVYDIGESYIKVSMQTSAKPNAVFMNDYVSKRYNQAAAKINFNLSHYVSIDNINQKTGCVFSQRELKKFITFCRESFKDNRSSGESTYLYQPEIREYYPDLLMVFEDNAIQIWRRKTDTTLLLRVFKEDFYELMNILDDMLKNFLVLSSNNTVIYSNESLAYINSKVGGDKRIQGHGDSPNRDMPFGDTHVIPDTIKEHNQTTWDEVFQVKTPTLDGQVFGDTANMEGFATHDDTLQPESELGQVEVEDEIDNLSSLGIDLESNDDPNDIPSFLR